VQLVSLIGVSGEDGTPDGFGKVLLADMESVGMRTDGLVQSQRASTAACTLTLEPDGDLVAGVADMGIVETMGSEVVSEGVEGVDADPVRWSMRSEHISQKWWFSTAIRRNRSSQLFCAHVSIGVYQVRQLSRSRFGAESR
jgi:hypothetical protein